MECGNCKVEVVPGGIAMLNKDKDKWRCPSCKAWNDFEKETDGEHSELNAGLDPSPVTLAIQEERLLRALNHLNEAMYPNVQFTGLMENMADEAISNMKISVHDAIEALREGNEDYFKLKGV